MRPSGYNGPDDAALVTVLDGVDFHITITPSLQLYAYAETDFVVRKIHYKSLVIQPRKATDNISKEGYTTHRVPWAGPPRYWTFTAARTRYVNPSYSLDRVVPDYHEGKRDTLHARQAMQKRFEEPLMRYMRSPIPQVVFKEFAETNDDAYKQKWASALDTLETRLEGIRKFMPLVLAGGTPDMDEIRPLFQTLYMAPPIRNN